MHYRSVIVWCVLALSSQQSASMECTSYSEYVYDRQPPTVIVCNPYINRALLLDCSITGPWPVQLQWYFSPAQSPLSSVLITNSSQYQLDDMSIQNTTTRIGLTVRGLSAASENVTTGYYWCQGSVPGGILTPSGKVTLQSAEYYRYVTAGCNPKVYLRSSDQACPVLLSQTALSTAPEPSQVMTTIPMATQSTIWPLNNPTPIQPVPPIWQATPSSGVNNDSEGSVPARNTASTDMGSDLAGGGMSTVHSSNTWLYIILGISALSLLVIVVLGFVIFSMCRRHVRKEPLNCQGMNANSDEKLSLSEHSLATGSLGGKAGLIHTPMPPPPPPPHRHIPYFQQTMDIHLPGDYAEVGPALAHRLQVSHDYSEIREFLPDINPQLLGTHTSGQQQLLHTPAQLLQHSFTPTEPHSYHTSGHTDDVMTTPTAIIHNLSAQFVPVNESESDDHTYHILQLSSGYSLSDNISEDDTAVVMKVGKQEVAIVTAPEGLVEHGVAIVTAPVETCESCKSTISVISSETADKEAITGEEGYSRLVSNPSSSSVLQMRGALQMNVEDTHYSHLVRIMEAVPLGDSGISVTEVVPLGDCGMESHAIDIISDTTLIRLECTVSDSLSPHLAPPLDRPNLPLDGPHLIAPLDGPHLVAPLDGSHLIAPLDGPHLIAPLDGPHLIAPLDGPLDGPHPALCMHLSISSNLTDISKALMPQGVAVAPQGVAVAPQCVAVAPQCVAVAPQCVAVAPQGVAVAPQQATAEELSRPLLSKYNGDYERDSAYMGALQWAAGRQSTTSYVNQSFLDDAHHITAAIPSDMHHSLESLCPEAHVYQALLSRTKEKAKQYTDLQLDGDQSKQYTDLQLDGDQSKHLQLDGDQSKQYTDLQLDGDQSKHLQLDGDQSKQYTDLQLDGDQSKQYTDLQLDGYQSKHLQLDGDQSKQYTDLQLDGDHLQLDGDQSKQYTDLQLDGDQSKHLQLDGDQSKHLQLDGDQSKHLQLDGDQSKRLQLDGDQSKRLQLDGDQSKHLQLDGDQSKQYTDLQLNGDQFKQHTNSQAGWS